MRFSLKAMGVLFILLGTIGLSLGCTRESQVESELVQASSEAEVMTESSSELATEAVINGVDAAELEAVVTELDSLVERILSESDSSKIQSVLDQFIAESDREIFYLYYGEADNDFWISPMTELPPDYAFSERAVYLNAVEKGVYSPEGFADALNGRTLQTVAKVVMVDGEVVGVIGIDYYIND